MRILVIGCGSIGERHIRNLKSLGAGEIYACDQQIERLQYVKDAYGIRTFQNYEAAFTEEDFSAVLICTPSSEHIAPALTAIRRGCHVFIEKPLSHNLDGVDDLIKEAKHRKLVLMSGFNLRFHPNLQKIKNLLDNEVIGKPISAKTHFGSYFLYRVPYRSNRSHENDYATGKIGGGVILDAATHQIDYVCWFFGEVKEVFCYCRTVSSFMEAEDIAEILLKFESKLIASLHADFIQQPYQNKCEIIGEKGTIAWNFTDNSVNLFSQKDNKWHAFTENIFDYNNTYINEIKHFIECIKDHEQPPVDGIKGKKVLEVALAALESSRKAKAITL